jgi:hypothetical protein
MTDEELRAGHAEPDEDESQYCRTCDEPWPCLPVRLLDRLARAEAVVEAARITRDEYLSLIDPDHRDSTVPILFIHWTTLLDALAAHDSGVGS